MKSKRFWLSVVVVYVVGFILSFLINGVWLGETYASLADVWRTEEELVANQWITFVTLAVFVFFFCYIFARGYEGKGWIEGARYGLVIGLFYTLPQAYDLYAVLPIPYSLALSWFVSGVGLSVVLGIVLAFVYKPDSAG